MVRTRELVCLAIVVALAACATAGSGDVGAPSPTAVPTPTVATPPPAAEVFALHRYAAQMPAGWDAPTVIAYGTAQDQLGTSSGGEGVDWGPSYGTVAADGTWWFLDAAKRRFARFDDTGTYLGEVAIPSEHLALGTYVQWQYPVGLADGTVVVYRLGNEAGSSLLLVHDGVLRRVDLDRQVTVETDDGRLLYGFGRDDELLAVDPRTGTVEVVDAFRSRAGVLYRLLIDGSALHFELPDLAVDRRWAEVTAETDTPASGAIDLVTTSDGRFHVFVDGAAEGEEGIGRSGYGVIERTGDLRPTEATRDPWSPSDDGTGSRLVARPNSDEVWFLAIDTDAVRLYRRG